ncbi:MAG: tRNA threonylcarbamoyladenosine dehydratase, partial [Erysipelotrichaceae bacterium]
VVDCIDTISAKINIIKNCAQQNIRVISSMGTGNKMHPELLKVDKIKNTTYCPLAKVMRRELHKLGLDNTLVVYSCENSPKIVVDSEKGRHAPSSMIFVPATAGLLLGNKVVLDIIND